MVVGEHDAVLIEASNSLADTLLGEVIERCRTLALANLSGFEVERCVIPHLELAVGVYNDHDSSIWQLIATLTILAVIHEIYFTHSLSVLS